MTDPSPRRLVIATKRTRPTQQDDSNDDSEPSIDARPARRRRLEPVTAPTDKATKTEGILNARYVPVGRNGQPARANTSHGFTFRPLVGVGRTHISNLVRAKEARRRKDELSRQNRASSSRPSFTTPHSPDPFTGHHPWLHQFPYRFTTPRSSRANSAYYSTSEHSAGEADDEDLTPGSETETDEAENESGEEVESQTRVRDWPDSPSPARPAPKFAFNQTPGYQFGSHLPFPFTFTSPPETIAAMPQSPTQKTRGRARSFPKTPSPPRTPRLTRRTAKPREPTPEGFQRVRLAQVVLKGDEEVLKQLEGEVTDVLGGFGKVQRKEMLGRVRTWEVESIGKEFGSLKANFFLSTSDMEISDSEIGRLFLSDRARELALISPSLASQARLRMKASDLKDAHWRSLGTESEMSLSFARRLAVKRRAGRMAIGRVGQGQASAGLMVGYSLIESVALSKRPMSGSAREIIATRGDDSARNERRRALLTAYHVFLEGKGLGSAHFGELLRGWIEAHATDPGYLAALEAFKAVKQANANKETLTTRRARLTSEERAVEDVLMDSLESAAEIDEAAQNVESALDSQPGLATRRRTPSVGSAELEEAQDRYRARRRVVPGSPEEERADFADRVDRFVEKMERRKAERDERNRAQRALEQEEASARREVEMREAAQREAYVAYLQEQANRERAEMQARQRAEENERAARERQEAFEREQQHFVDWIEERMRASSGSSASAPRTPEQRGRQEPVPAHSPPVYASPDNGAANRAGASSSPTGTVTPPHPTDNIEPPFVPPVPSPRLPNYAGDLQYRTASPPPPPPYNATAGFSVVDQEEEAGVMDLLDELDEEDEDDYSDDGFQPYEFRTFARGEEHWGAEAEPVFPGGNAGLGLGMAGGQPLNMMTLEEMQAEEQRIDEAERQGRSWWGALRGWVGI